MDVQGNKSLYEQSGRVKFNLLTVMLCAFLLLFPVDSALGNIIGDLSVNNFIAMACVGLLLLSSRELQIKARGLAGVLFLYLAFQCVTMVYAPSPMNYRNLVMVFYTVFAILLGNVVWEKREKDLILAATLLGGTCCFVIVLLEALTTATGRTYITMSTYMDPNYMGTNLIFTTAILTCSLFKSKRKYLYALFLCVDFIVLLCLGTRTGLFANLTVLLIILCQKIKNIKAYLIGIPALVAIYFLMMAILPDWLAKRFNIINIVTGTGSGRTTIWKEYLSAYAGAPILTQIFGYGRSAVYAYDELGISNNCTHNIYIKALIEGGMVGAILLFALFGFILWYVKKQKNKTLYALVLGYLVGGMFLDVDDYRIAYVFYMFLFIFANDGLIMPYVGKEKTWFYARKKLLKGYAEPIVSVVVPVYNVREYVTACVRSITAQTYKNLEIILVDDGSTDGSGELCDELAKEDCRIRVLHKSNGGLSSARNAGIEDAKGSFLTFVDGDDGLAARCVEQLMAVHMQTGADMTVGDFSRKEEALTPKGEERQTVFQAEEVICEMLKDKFPVSACAKLYKRELFAKLRFPEGWIYEDYALVPKVVAEANKVAYVCSNVYYYRLNLQSITGCDFNPKRMQFFQVAQEMERYFAEQFPRLLKKAKLRHTRYAVSFYRQVAQSGFTDEKIERELIRYVRKGIFKYCLFADAPISSKAYGIALSIMPKTAKKIMRKRR